MEEVDRAIIMVTRAKESGSFEPRRGIDMLTVVLQIPEHHGHIRGMSSRMSWKGVARFMAVRHEHVPHEAEVQ
jgi:hypothetical protein